MAEKSKTLQKKIDKLRGKDKPKVAKKRNGRDISDDNLTALERSILNFLAESDEPVSVKQIAIQMYGEDVVAEAKGKESVRTIRNALRIPKAMDLITPEGSGMYSASKSFKKWGFKAAKDTAAAWKADRDSRKAEEASAG
jgi:repressor of nif and glnA expression